MTRNAAQAREGEARRRWSTDCSDGRVARCLRCHSHPHDTSGHGGRIPTRGQIRSLYEVGAEKRHAHTVFPWRPSLLLPLPTPAQMHNAAPPRPPRTALTGRSHGRSALHQRSLKKNSARHGVLLPSFLPLHRRSTPLRLAFRFASGSFSSARSARAVLLLGSVRSPE